MRVFNIFLAASSVLAQDESTTVALDDFQRGRNKKKQQVRNTFKRPTKLMSIQTRRQLKLHNTAMQLKRQRQQCQSRLPLHYSKPFSRHQNQLSRHQNQPRTPMAVAKRRKSQKRKRQQRPRRTRQSTRPRLRKIKLKQRHGQAPAIRMAVVATRAPMAILIFTLSVSVPISPTCASISLVSQVPRSRYWRTKLLGSVQLVSCSSQMKKKRAFTSSQSH